MGILAELRERPTQSVFGETGSHPHLGRSTRLGLPTGQTALKTGGVYRFSRNPMYLGFHVLTLASVFATGSVFVLGTSGSNAGVQAGLTVWKDEDLVVVVLANSWGVVRAVANERTTARRG